VSLGLKAELELGPAPGMGMGMGMALGMEMGLGRGLRVRLGFVEQPLSKSKTFANCQRHVAARGFNGANSVNTEYLTFY